jgi:hypothetical protein|tara:strand:- start:253 stop:429 length:177 start_codon:yes stop_codon:yes gene_type:complete
MDIGMALCTHATGIIGAVLPTLASILNVMEVLRRAFPTCPAHSVSGEDISPYRGSESL